MASQGMCLRSIAYRPPSAFRHPFLSNLQIRSFFQSHTLAIRKQWTLHPSIGTQCNLHSPQHTTGPANPRTSSPAQTPSNSPSTKTSNGPNQPPNPNPTSSPPSPRAKSPKSSGSAAPTLASPKPPCWVCNPGTSSCTATSPTSSRPAI